MFLKMSCEKCWPASTVCILLKQLVVWDGDARKGLKVTLP